MNSIGYNAELTQGHWGGTFFFLDKVEKYAAQPHLKKTSLILWAPEKVQLFPVKQEKSLLSL